MKPERLPSLSLLPEAVPEEELVWHWFEGISPFHESTPLVDPQSTNVLPTHRRYHVGSFLFLDTTFPAQEFLRNPTWRRKNDNVDYLLLQVFLHGRNQIGRDGRSFVQEVGAVTAVDPGHDVEGSATEAEVLTLILPRDWLAQHVPALRDVRGILFGESPMATRLFLDFMLSLRRHLPEATAEDVPLLTQSLIGMLAALATHGDTGAADANNGVFMALRRFIDDNLDDPDLGAATLCARFHLSRATLFRLFKNQGGVQSYIQRQRLMACFKALSSPQHFHRMIYHVALDYGFANASHLTTLFRKHFAMTPSEVREAARAQVARGITPSLPATDRTMPDVERMQAWAHSLSASIAASVPQACG